MGDQSITCCLCCFFLLRERTPHIPYLVWHGISPMGTWICVLATGCSFSRTAPKWVPSMGCSPLGTSCFIVSLPCSHVSCHQTCSNMDSLLHQFHLARILPGIRSSTSFPLGQSCLQASTCTSMRLSLLCLQGDLCFPVGLYGPHHGLHHGLHGTSAPGASPPLTSPPTLISTWLIISYILTPFWLFFCRSLVSFPSWIHYPESATPTADGCILGQWWVPLGASWHRLSWTWGKLLTASHRRHAFSPHAPKFCYANWTKLSYQKAENLIGK